MRFWEAWQDELAAVRLLDPACGSGAFLIEAFDQLHAAYQASNDRLEELRGHRTLFDLDKRILENNLYGVDLNEEAIEICRLSLWIKTAERGKALTSLDHTIRVGNSIVADPAVHPKAFDWQAAFPGSFLPSPRVRAVAAPLERGGEGGFDVVLPIRPTSVRSGWRRTRRILKRSTRATTGRRTYSRTSSSAACRCCATAGDWLSSRRGVGSAPTSPRPSESDSREHGD